MQKVIAIALLICLALSFAGTAFADENSLISKVEQAQGDKGEAIRDEVDKIGYSIVNFVRSIFAVVAVVFVIWAGFVFWGAGGNPEAIARAKKLAAGFIICIIGVYSAETIVGGILGILGYGK